MIQFKLNDKDIYFQGNEEDTLLKYLRLEAGIVSVKDGCSSQAVCGACLVEIDGMPKLSCVTKIKNLGGKQVYTLEGVPENIRETIAKTFVNEGAVQCGFCTPGFVMRTRLLLKNNPNPTELEIKNALKQHLCRCTGYKKIEKAILLSAKALRENTKVEIRKSGGAVGAVLPKYDAELLAVGKRLFVNDMMPQNCLYAALKFSDFPRAKVLNIDVSEAENLQGVVRIFTAKDVLGSRRIGLIFNDWNFMIGIGETTNYIGDVVAAVVAENEEIARKALKLIKIEYEVLQPVTDVFQALTDEIKVHEEKSNLLENCVVKQGNAEAVLQNSKFRFHGVFETQRIEHAFMECESAIATYNSENSGVTVYSQGQGVYVDRKQIAALLNIPENRVRVQLVSNGGGFGGKEDLTVQGHVALFSFLLKNTVKLTLTREESIRMHPKRHPVVMDMEAACDEFGMLTALKLRAIGDTGAYASVGTKVMERIAGHATVGYYVPNIDLEAKTVYTNNIPNGAMRGFGANQVAFAFESCIDELCKLGGFDRWQFRFNNALVDGLKTATGQTLYGVGIRQCLLALKDEFYNAKFAGLSTAIKNSGVGNGMIDESKVKIKIHAANNVEIQHGWTEMGQGVHTVAIQTLCHETGIPPEIVKVTVDTVADITTGMTTSSRGTALLGNAIIDACKELKKDLTHFSLENLAGKEYFGSFVCDWTSKPNSGKENPVIHYSYGYAAQLCILNDEGKIEKIVAAHDAGKVINPQLFEGQIEGGVHMGIGYAISENLPMKNGFLVSSKLKDCGVLRAHETPDIVVKAVEVPDKVGPYGAKGVGEIGLVPTAAAIANAVSFFDGVRRYKLPISDYFKKKK